MGRSRHKFLRFGLAFVALLAAFTGVSARPQLTDLNITVELADNGDARITERRVMSIDDEGTECYIVIGNLNGSEVKDLEVTDENGLQFSNIGEWDVERSRSWKAGKCGIVYKRNGYELCWGLGESGQRVYETSYTVTRLVKGFDDADGFNYMFVAENVSPLPSHVKLTISKPGTPFVEDSVKVWAFRFRGTIMIEDSCVVAETSEDFSPESAMIAMVRFPKGMFEPEDVREGSFDQLKERAFEGSDYVDNRSFWQKLWDNLEVVFYAFIMMLTFFVPVIYMIWMWWKKRKFRKRVEQDLNWYRDIPYKGNLQHTHAICEAAGYSDASAKNLLSAYVLRMVYRGELTVKEEMNPKNGKIKQYLAIGKDHELTGSVLDDKLEHKLFDIFKKAAGDDGVLQPHELERYMARHAEGLQPFVKQLKTSVGLSQCEKEFEEVRQTIGLKKFLKDFTIVDERHVKEVSLWKDYLIFASLFGMADQVRKDMKSINPEFFQLDKVAEQMAQSTVVLVPNLSNAAMNGTRQVESFAARQQARSSGGGGFSSWGGGGGFAGGGSGGGVR